jgi:AbrB family looped-hinge helix DNA binding protein
MRTATSKLTRKYQATIPERVRAALGLRAGDSVAFDMDGDKVRVRKARPIDLAFAQAVEGTLQEWGTAADEKAFRDL